MAKYTAPSAGTFRMKGGTLADKLCSEYSDIEDAYDPSYMVVSTQGSDTTGTGSFANPYKTITKALTLVTTARKMIFVMPGDYDEAALLTWPNVTGLLITGIEDSGAVNISNANSADEVILINPTFTTATFEASLANLNIAHDAQIGLAIDNENMGTRKLNIYLKNVSFEAESTGDSISISHTTAGQAIRLYATDCNEIEGLVDIATATADDRFRFDHCTAIGGITVTGAIASEITLLHTTVLTSAFTTNATNVVTTLGSVYRTDAGVFTELADAFSA